MITSYLFVGDLVSLEHSRKPSCLSETSLPSNPIQSSRFFVTINGLLLTISTPPHVGGGLTVDNGYHRSLNQFEFRLMGNCILEMKVKISTSPPLAAYLVV